MLLTAAIILFLLALPFRALRQGFYALHTGLVLATLWFLYGTGGALFTAPSLRLFLIIHLLWINITLFLAYGYDKQAAKKGKWRIRENSLHAMALLGGTPAAFLGGRVFRHKTRKTSFRILFWLALLVQLLVLALLHTLAQGHAF